ncbi:hypothetical protein K1719_000670 [Acacia pycnantha]|nr:hypothetical protein K1719_000670 [Acacia pycnantha]
MLCYCEVVTEKTKSFLPDLNKEVLCDDDNNNGILMTHSPYLVEAPSDSSIKNPSLDCHIGNDPTAFSDQDERHLNTTVDDEFLTEHGVDKGLDFEEEQNRGTQAGETTSDDFNLSKRGVRHLEFEEEHNRGTQAGETALDEFNLSDRVWRVDRRKQTTVPFCRRDKCGVLKALRIPRRTMALVISKKNAALASRSLEEDDLLTRSSKKLKNATTLYKDMKLTNKEDYLHALTGGPWMLFDHYLTVRPWEPAFQPMTASINKVAVWDTWRVVQKPNRRKKGNIDKQPVDPVQATGSRFNVLGDDVGKMSGMVEQKGPAMKVAEQKGAVTIFEAKSGGEPREDAIVRKSNGKAGARRKKHAKAKIVAGERDNTVSGHWEQGKQKRNRDRVSGDEGKMSVQSVQEDKGVKEGEELLMVTGTDVQGLQKGGKVKEGDNLLMVTDQELALGEHPDGLVTSELESDPLQLGPQSVSPPDGLVGRFWAQSATMGSEEDFVPETLEELMGGAGEPMGQD